MAEQRPAQPTTFTTTASGGGLPGTPAGAERQVRLRLDERNLTAHYTNAFRTFVAPEEVIIDFGMNLVTQPPGAAGPAGEDGAGEILFQLNDRVIMNYQTAKRIAITLSQIVHRHEERNGEIKLAGADRAR